MKKIPPKTSMQHSLIYFLLSALCLAACNENSQPSPPSTKTIKSTKSRTLLLQPMSDSPNAAVHYLQKKMTPIFDSVVIMANTNLPDAAFYKPRKRYRADSLIRFLREGHSDTEVVLGLTQKDISTTKGAIPDWGIMGLAYQPGTSCVVSTFRLKGSNENLFKVAIHELAHTEGLPHCKTKYCYLRDAEGGNPLKEETSFCPNCRNYLVQRGWKLL